MIEVEGRWGVRSSLNQSFQDLDGLQALILHFALALMDRWVHVVLLLRRLGLDLVSHNVYVPLCGGTNWVS